MIPRNDPYLANRVATTSPEQLILMLLDRGIAELHKAQADYAAGDAAAARPHLYKGQDIVAELRCSLDLDAGPIAQNLDAIYDFAFRRLVDAHLGADGALVGEAIAVLSPIQDAWRQISGAPLPTVDLPGGVSAHV